jgi:hypothetical protein
MVLGNLRYEVVDLQHKAEEQEDMFNTLANDLIESRIELQKATKEKDKVLEGDNLKNNKILQLEAENLWTLKCIEELKARMKRGIKTNEPKYLN